MIRSVERQGSTKAQDGRTLTFIERGDPGGVPVIVCHGTPGSRYTRHPDPELYERHGTHFVAYDRPGYGGSDPQPGRSVAAAAGDIQAIADELGFERFAVVGGSGGAPHALACGALLGDRVTRVGALVTPAPSDAEEFDFFAGLAELNIKEFGAALEGREAIDAYIQPFVDAMQADPDSVIDEIASELPEVDRAIVSREEFRRIMRQSFAEAVRQGVRGWSDDDLAFAKPWGFALEDVDAEVRLWQGELDVLAPRSHGEYVASRLPNARFELLEGGGHFLDEEWAVVLEWLAARAAV
ncbi:MAG: alpha/beta hydrolase [Actinobacteria bacterium]|nr:MAG: alpha/beta hydrolase [Actinomycetota bacterium]